MPFLNSYNSQGSPIITTVLPIRDFIFSTGIISETKIFLMKVDLSGEIIWQKQYTPTGIIDANASRIIACDNDELILLIREWNFKPNYGLMRISASTGEVIWYKVVTDPVLHGNDITDFHNLGNEKYLLSINGKYSTANNNSQWQYLLMMDGSGNIIKKNRIGFTGNNNIKNVAVLHYQVYQIIAHDNNYIYVTSGNGFLKLDYNLNLLGKFYIKNFHTAVTGVKLIDGELFVSFLASFGDDPENASMYLKINFPSTGASVPSTYYSSSKRVVYTDSSHLYIVDNNTKSISKYDAITKNLISSKTIQAPLVVPREIHIVDGNILFGLFYPWPVLAYLNSDLTSCKTEDGDDLPTLGTKYIEVETDYAISEDSNFTLTVNTYLITAEAISFTKSDICDFDEQVSVKNNTMLQSPHLYLQSAGSIGTDSTKGVHLRWMLKNGLAKHLPKGNYAAGTANFNKPNDYVKIYRAPYSPQVISLNFANTPITINDTSKTWLYSVGLQLFFVHFETPAVYNTVRSSINPNQNPHNFIAVYFNNGGVLEIENQNELSFAVTTQFNTVSQATVKVEYLSVEENKVSAPKFAALRKQYSFSAINGVKHFNENTRGIRLQSTGTYPLSITFELYSDFLTKANRDYVWEELGEYALTLDDSVAFSRLEPVANTVHGKWLRYNNSAYVNIANYKDKWNGLSVPADERIKEGVSTYITLSNDVANPDAIQEYSYEPVPGQIEGEMEASTFEISNLFLLQTASLDYHIARMMGLGILDTNSEINSGQHIYLAEYTTFGNLNDGLGSREVHHLYMSLPTSLNDQRLPIALDLQEPKPGIYTANQIESPASITGPDGYSHDGKTRFLSLFHADLPNETANQSFFYKNDEFISSANTVPVYAGIEYKRLDAPQWRKPELPYDNSYKNIDTSVTDEFQKSETLSIVIPEPGDPLFVHREKESGWHRYSSYGINWFGRATSSSLNHDIETIIAPENQMLPPTNVNAVLIQKERPLFLTSAAEQDMLQDLLNNSSIEDKTLIRLYFEYNHAQELINYHQKIGAQLVSGYSELPDSEEQFADELEIFFRNRMPGTISGKVAGLLPAGDVLKVTVQTGPYLLNSTTQDNGQTVQTESIIPSIPVGSEPNYIGSILVINGDEYIIDAIDNLGEYPKITIFKRTASSSIDENTTGIPGTLLQPELNSMFYIVENMQNPASWNTSSNINPLSLKVNVEPTVIHRESVIVTNIDGVEETYIEKFRGIYEDAIITKILEDLETGQDSNGDPITESRHIGLYEIEFPGYTLAQHNQYTMGSDSVEFSNGIARVHTLNAPQGRRKELKVVRIENVGIPGASLKLYVSDLSFPYDPDDLDTYEGKLIADGTTTASQKVNYYPGYKVYLYHDPTHGLTQEQILPGEDEDVRYSIFGIRSHEVSYQFVSPLSVPAVMFARKLEEPEQPEKPVGPMFATRPDFFGKASYTFTTKFEPRPYSVQFSRASDIQILSALYNPNLVSGNTLSTVEDVMQNIFLNGDEEFYEERWADLLSFDYEDGAFATYREVSLPYPDNPNFYSGINFFIEDHNRVYGSSIDLITQSSINDLNAVIIPGLDGVHGELLFRDFIKDAIYNCFVPLTEIPIIYKYIKGGAYIPIPKKQVVRDRNGNLLNPNAPDFDMAPMMKIVSESEYITQFTDFGLDGASNAKYFYAAREFNLQMQAGLHSDILGPISLVNTAPPAAPDIVRVLSVLENRSLQIEPAIQFEINAYPEAHNIKKINIYRTNDRANSLSVRTMELVKVIDIDTEGIANNDRWVFYDDFSDLSFVPYGDPLYYRVTVERKIKYNNSSDELIVDYAPSESSKVILTNIVNNQLPDSPVLTYYSEPLNNGMLNYVILSWDQTVYNGKYIIYKMTSNGNWEKFQEVVSNLPIMYIPIGDLQVRDSEGNPIYHHFKVMAQNFSGMLSNQEHILTIYNEDTWQDIGGIGDMIIEGTFIIR